MLTRKVIIGLSISVSLAVVLFSSRGYIFLIIEPTRADLAVPVQSSIARLYINNIPIEISNYEWSMNRWNSDPIPFFGGLKQITLEYEEGGIDSMKDDTYLLLTLNLRNKIPVGQIIEYSETDMIESLIIKDINSNAYIGTKKQSDPSCTLDDSAVDGEIIITKYSQTWKRFVLEGEINISPSNFSKNYSCENGITYSEGIELVEIQQMKFAIDSPVIYEWSNKAGDTWRL